MIRPCFLVVDREYSQSISTRKLVIETAKFNVITAYSSGEALELIQRFPGMDGVVVDSDVPDMGCPEFVRKLKDLAPAMPVIGVSSPLVGPCEEADYQLESFDPRRLLELLENLRPKESAEVEQRNEELALEQHSEGLKKQKKQKQ
jgi:DNA-binding NtrC family response regulator